MGIAKKLKAYAAKRKLKKSGEPKAKVEKGKGKRFVVQKHWARQLHYDFRLEAGGVLKSWAVPKGPPTVTGVQRLAIEVEDHPVDYIGFEGIIPEGYGKGKVKIWDKGTYEGELKEGKIHVVLHGKKLKGEYALNEFREKQWLMRKMKKAGTAKRETKFEKEYAFLSNVNKVYWPKEKITKGQLLNYYASMSGVILPYLEGRPESLRRFPDGIEGKSFFQKNVKDAPKWAETVKVKGINYLVIEDARSLLYAVNLGCIELHPMLSRVGKLDRPDFLVMDLDPVGVGFDKVVEVALGVREVLEEAGVKSYCKTSGGRGMHVCVPLGARYSYEVAKRFALAVAEIVHRGSGYTSLERLPKKRKGKVYIDCYQNNPGQTIAAPYCVRAKEGAPVSMPLAWKEVKKGIESEDFTIFNAKKRVEKTGDLFAGVLGHGANLEAALKKLEKL